MIVSPNLRWPRKTEEKNEVLYESIKKAYEAGFAAAKEAAGAFADFEEAEDYWAFDHRKELEKSSKKNSPGRPAKKSSPKKPEETNDLACKEFNPEFCKARKWNKGDDGDLSPDEPGHGMQCWFAAVDGGFCEKCAEKHGDETKENWGLFCEPLRKSPGQKANGKPHPWKALKKEEKVKAKEAKAQEKRAKEKEEKEVKEKKEKKEKKKEKKEKKGKKEKKQKKEKKEKEEPAKEEPEKEDSDAETEDLEEDSTHYKEFVHNGFPLKWNTETNELLDPTDEELLGNMEKDEDGDWVPKMVSTDDGDSDSDSGSDSDSDDEDSDSE